MCTLSPPCGAAKTAFLEAQFSPVLAPAHLPGPWRVCQFHAASPIIDTICDRYQADDIHCPQLSPLHPAPGAALGGRALAQRLRRPWRPWHHQPERCHCAQIGGRPCCPNQQAGQPSPRRSAQPQQRRRPAARRVRSPNPARLGPIRRQPRAAPPHPQRPPARLGPQQRHQPSCLRRPAGSPARPVGAHAAQLCHARSRHRSGAPARAMARQPAAKPRTHGAAQQQIPISHRRRSRAPRPAHGSRAGAVYRERLQPAGGLAGEGGWPVAVHACHRALIRPDAKRLPRRPARRARLHQRRAGLSAASAPHVW